MTISRAIRLLLSMVSICIVGWAFAFVGLKAIRSHRALRERPVTLTVLHWGNPAEDKIVRTLCEQFQRDHPTVQINRINPGGGSGDMRNKLKTMMSAGLPPDVFYLPPDLLPELVEMGLIAPLDARFNENPRDFDHTFYSSAQQWRDDFFPLILNAFRYDKLSGTTGKGPLYALPKDFTTAVFYVNCDLLDKAGVDWRAVQKNGWSWDQFESEMRKVRALNGQAEFAGREIFGTLFQIWPDSLRNVLWTFGADFFATGADGSVDFKHVALDTPAAQAGLDLIARMRLKERTAFNASGIAKDGGQEFLNGNIGCTGPIGVWMVPTYKSITRFRWDIVPVPHGTTQASQAYYTGWTMSSQSKFPDEAFKLIRFLCGKDGQIMQARLQLAIPSLQSVAYSPDFLHPPPPEDPDEIPIPPYHAQTFLDAVHYMRLQQIPRQAEWGQIVEQDINRAIVTGQRTPMQAARDIQADWTNELNSPLRQKQWKPMPWGSILSITAALIATLALLLWVRARRERIGPLDRATERAGWMFILPWVIGFLCLALGPMIASLLLGFTRWTGLNSLAHAEFVGTANYRQLFSRDATFVQSLKVTAYYVMLSVPIAQIASLAVAMLMNLRLRGIRIFRTIYFVPSVVSGVAMAVLWLQLFNDSYGLINQALRPVFGLFGTRPPNWFGVDTTVTPPTNDAAVWAIPAFVIMGLWSVGGGMIIYLAGLKGIPGSLYEAATIDGAGPVRRFWNVTLPMLSPLIFYNLVMGIIGSFQIFTQAYVMTGPGPDNATLFYVLNLYRQAFEFHNMGYASAMAWVLFLIVLALTITVFRASKNLVYYEGLKA
jgi:multiple sugar transport system permease protein